MRILAVLVLTVCVWGVCSAACAEEGSEAGVPILLYHRFGPAVADSMTVRTAVFEAHLKYLQAAGFEVIALKELLTMLAGEGVPAGRRCAVLVADDAHRSVYTEAFPLLKKYRVPMTLFVYPSAVSNAPYAMTWEQLHEVKASGLCDIQSHTYWHPNFKKEREKLPAAEFEKLVQLQLVKSRTTLERKLGGTVDLLAWPFGIFDSWLMERAAAAGYRAAFSIERRPATRRDHPMALPRYLLADSDRDKLFEALVNTPFQVARRENRHVERRF
ncbi:MAG: polysaccharide deacetylase family protein [Desulfobacterales bacterium]|nr:polysaccharide deacetylase family protein [Desulfobacterales bacterium]